MALSKKQLKTLGSAIFVVFLVLFCDQSLKIWVKTNMQLYQMYDIFSWFKIYFIENAGMAFGIKVVDTYVLTIFRMIVAVAFGVIIYKLIKRGFQTGYIVSLSLILAGAVGNIIDCAFYGVFFGYSPEGHGVASFMPGGKADFSNFLHGKVVDMLYFPLIKTTWPSWVPVWGGEDFTFFSPIFNLADSAICVGAFILLLFYRKTMSASFMKEEKDTDDK